MKRTMVILCFLAAVTLAASGVFFGGSGERLSQTASGVEPNVATWRIHVGPLSALEECQPV
jgi:hypothetical protein